MRYVYWVLTLLVAIACAIFAVKNNVPVSVNLWPFADALEMPIFILVLGTSLVGLLVGLVAGWLLSMPARLARRRLTMRLAVAEADVARLKAQISGQTAAALPAVPAKVDA